MVRGSRRFVFLLALAGAALAACSSAEATSKKREPIDPFGAIDEGAPERPIATQVSEDSGAYGAPERPSHAGNAADAGAVTRPIDDRPDAGAPVADAGVVTKTYCPLPPAAGDVVIVELMIASRSGAGDDGEWVELRSTRDCWLALGGATVESPRGLASTDVVTLPAGTELAPGASLVVADSADPAKNHGVPGAVFAWNAADVLKNDGDTVRVTLGGAVLDTLTYPAFTNLTPGRSIAFPSDCAPADRASFQRWSLAFATFAPGFRGTPNAPNADVACF